MIINELLEKIEARAVMNSRSDKKLADVIKGDAVNSLPVIFLRPTNASVPGNTYSLKEQFYDKKKMLAGHLEEIEKVCARTFDAKLCLRPNFGTIFIPAMFGLSYEVFDDRYPWLVTHMDKKDLGKFKISGILSSEMMQRTVEYIEYFKSVLPGYIHVYMPDTQGPFDLAHLIYGDELFYEMYDDAGFVHELMDMCTQTYIAVSKRLKAALGEPLYECFHGHALARGLYMDSGGVRISEDSATLISPQQIEEFVIPYVKKAFEPFGGGFIHYCGKSEPLLDAFLGLEEVRAINFGNPEMYEFESTMKKFTVAGKCCFGQWPKIEAEKPGEYVSRMKGATDNGTRGLLLHLDEDLFPSHEPEDILKLFENEGE